MSDDSSETGKESVERVVADNNTERKLCNSADQKINHELINQLYTRRRVLVVLAHDLENVDHRGDVLISDAAYC